MHTDPVWALVEAIITLPGVSFADHDEHLPEGMGDFLVAVDFCPTEEGWAALSLVVRACQAAGDRVDVVARHDAGELGFCLRGGRGADPEAIADGILAAR